MSRLTRVLAVTGLAALPLVVSPAAQAQTAQFNVMLGSRQIGTLSFGSGSLHTETTNAPFGLGNGSFIAGLKSAQDDRGNKVLAYSGHSKSRKEDRQINILFDGTKPLRTTVTPESEMTDVSDVTKVAGQVVDPIRAFGSLLSVKSCPSLRLYDGRRVAEIATTQADAPQGQLICKGEYRVVAGALHVMPIGIRHAAMTLTYGAAGDGFALAAMQLDVGPMTISFVR